MTKCPEYLKQHVIQHGIPATIEQLLLFAEHLREIAARAATSYEADEYDQHRWAQCQRDCDVLNAAKDLYG